MRLVYCLLTYFLLCSSSGVVALYENYAIGGGANAAFKSDAERANYWLPIAALMNDEKRFKEFLDQADDIDASHGYGRSTGLSINALMGATMVENAVFVQQLLNKGADKSIMSNPISNNLEVRDRLAEIGIIYPDTLVDVRKGIHGLIGPMNPLDLARSMNASEIINLLSGRGMIEQSKHAIPTIREKPSKTAPLEQQSTSFKIPCYIPKNVSEAESLLSEHKRRYAMQKEHSKQKRPETSSYISRVDPKLSEKLTLLKDSLYNLSAVLSEHAWLPS